MVDHGPLRSSLRAIGVIAALVLALAGCSGGDDPDAAGGSASTSVLSATTSPTTATPSTVESVEDEAAVRAAYEAASKAFVDAAAVPNPDDPALAATHVDPMLQQRHKTLRALKADGRVIRYPPNSQYRVDVLSVDVDGDVARLTFCAVDDGERVVVATGEVISNGVASVRGRAAMRRDKGTWKLAEQLFDVREKGGSACASAG